MLNEIKKLITDDNDICIVMDFDYTLTDYSSYSSIGVFSNYLCNDYVKKKNIIDEKINCLDDDDEELYKLWREKMILLRKYSNKSIVNKIIKDDNFTLRSELVDILKFASYENVDVFIISSGCKEIIEKVLVANNINLNNVKLIANSFIDFDSKIVTPKNKKEFFNSKYSFHVVLGDERSDFFIKDNAYYVEYFNDYTFRELSRYENKKCVYGLGLYKGKKIFYKTLSDGIKDEIKNYNLVNKYYKIPKIISYSHNTILYEYREEFINKAIYDYLYRYDKLYINYESILNGYKESLKNIKCINEAKLKNNLFYKKRADILDRYINNENYSKYKHIFIDVKNKILKSKKLYSFISQGDPCDTNITVNGLFCDFETSGYNSVVGEIAIFVISILSHGAYIYPKYNSKAYNIKFSGKAKNKVSDKNTKLLVKYLEFYKNNLNENVMKELDKYLKYYICFRIVTPIDLDIMDKKDRNNLLNELNKFYSTKSFNQIIETIKERNYGM